MNNYSQKELELALQNCAAEPIHQIGHIQPHGALLVLSSDRRRLVLQASENLAKIIDLPIANPHGRPLAEMIGDTEAGQIEQLIHALGKNRVATGSIIISQRSARLEAQARVFASGDDFV